MVQNQDIFDTFVSILPASKSASNEIYFEALNPDALDEFHNYSTDERLYEFLEFNPFVDISESKNYLNKLLSRMSGDVTSRKCSYWFIRRYYDDVLIGTAGLVNLDYGRKSVEWGFGVDPKFWGMGYILEIQENLKKFVFENMELNRLYGCTMLQNHRTIKSLLASGFTHEGTARDHYCKGGKYSDGWQYAMTRSDYLSQATVSIQQELVIMTDDIIRTLSLVLVDEIITAESTMENTTSWDSLSHMEIILALKAELSINLLPSEIAKATSVQNIAQLVIAKNKK